MIASNETLRNNVARGRKLAQHVADPSVRLALLEVMNRIDADLAVAAPPMR